MKIAILGTRGIPNNYGGFEECAENLSFRFVEQGHDVTVYSPNEHPYKKNEWKGVKIKKIYANEKKLKLVGTLIYDYLCLKDAVKNNFDIILELGYDPDSIFFDLKKKTKAVIVTNMDGLDWKRSKFSYPVQQFIKFCEKVAVKKSDALIADNIGIQNYLKEKYNVTSSYIPYGAILKDNLQKIHLEHYNVTEFQYYLLISRLEPENNIEIILDGYLKSKSTLPFLVIGNLTTRTAKRLKKKYIHSPRIQFLGGIYDYDILSSLRCYARFYFHGHTVGGTNPSLLEAMATNAYIVAHNNQFNKNVINGNALYFSNSKDISHIIKSDNSEKREEFIQNNRNKISTHYKWESIATSYLKVFTNLLMNKATEKNQKEYYKSLNKELEEKLSNQIQIINE